MKDMMLIKNHLYTLYECDSSTFVLKSEVEEALAKGEKITCLSPRVSMCFNGKYYAYIEVSSKKVDEAILQTGFLKNEDEQQQIRKADNGDA